jgi:hypothetical protein
VDTGTKETLVGVSVWVVIIAGLVWGWSSLKDWSRDRTASACQPYVTLYEQIRPKAEQLRVSLLNSLLPGFPENMTATEQSVMDAYAVQRSLAGKAADIALANSGCFGGSAVYQAELVKHSPVTIDLVYLPRPGGRCRDGWASGSIGQRGACSHHGGVDSGGAVGLYNSAEGFGRVLGSSDQLPIGLAAADEN